MILPVLTVTDGADVPDGLAEDVHQNDKALSNGMPSGNSIVVFFPAEPGTLKRIVSAAMVAEDPLAHLT